MTLTETYLFLLADSFISGLVLPAKPELVFSAMRIFGGYDLRLAGFISTIGITIAACANWLLGRAMLSLKKYTPDAPVNPKVEKILVLLKQHGYLAGLLGFVPVFGPILIVFTGLVQTQFIKVIVLVFVVNLVWFGRYLF